MKTLIFTFTVLTLSVNISFAQLNTENLFKAPFISSTNTQQSMQSVMQNSEKDIVFIENLGQIRDSKGNKRPDVLFLTRSQGVDMYITSSGITYVFRKTEGDMKDKNKTKDAMPKSDGRQVKTSLYRLDMEFAGMNKNFKVKKELAVEQQFNYYTPEYPNGISPKAFKKITIENIYDGIDLVYYEKEGKMKYDFVVKAGADPDNIKMEYKGAGNVYIDKDGSVIVTTPMGEIREEIPYTYSRNTGKEIESRYEVRNNLVQFNIAEYNKSEDIIIDPYRIWATYYGGSDYDEGRSICTDNSGNLYVTGHTQSIDFPIQTLQGAYNDTTFGGGGIYLPDVFILKFNSSGARLWATYYGGSSNDCGYSICTDNSGNIYVTGKTYSTNFPIHMIPGPYAYNQIQNGGRFDAFILKFNSSCARLWATYYGGDSNDVGYSICTDNSGNFYVTGYTRSPNFPLKRLLGAYNQNFSGNTDVFILKFSSSCARLWATYYGGSSYEQGYGICSDNSGNIYVTGVTHSTNFPTQLLPGAYNQTTKGGNTDAFILKFNSSGARLWATYYGASGYECGLSICIDNIGNLYVTGNTSSTNFPLQNFPGAYNQTTYGGGWDGDAFILKFNSSGFRLWATYYGGSSRDYGYGICSGKWGNLYVTGHTKSTNFPTQLLPGAYNQTTHGGGISDAFILKFNSSCKRKWASYYGGSSNESGLSTCTGGSFGNLYVTGDTRSINFPIQTLSGAYNQTTYGGGNNEAFILKFVPVLIAPALASPLNGALSVVTNPLLDWDSVETAESYRVQVSTDSLFRTTVYDSSNITITEFQVPNNGLNTNTLYYWRVNATNVGGTSPYSIVFHFTTGATNISGNNEIPKEFKLYNNYPNPFNPSTKIKFDIPSSAFVKMIVYNVLGKELTTLVNEKLPAGRYEVHWSGSGYTSGVYFYKLITGDFVDVKKMLLVK